MRTFSVSAVRPAEFSDVCRPLCGPGLGFSPFLNAASTLRVVSEVRSSCVPVQSCQGPSTSTKTDRGTHIEVVANNHHWRITARALTLDLDDSELAVLGRLARLDTAELGTDGVENVVRAAEHAGRGCAYLDEVLTDRFPTDCMRLVAGEHECDAG